MTGIPQGYNAVATSSRQIEHWTRSSGQDQQQQEKGATQDDPEDPRVR